MVRMFIRHLYPPDKTKVDKEAPFPLGFHIKPEVEIQKKRNSHSTTLENARLKAVIRAS